MFDNKFIQIWSLRDRLDERWKSRSRIELKEVIKITWMMYLINNNFMYYTKVIYFKALGLNIY